MEQVSSWFWWILSWLRTPPNTLQSSESVVGGTAPPVVEPTNDANTRIQDTRPTGTTTATTKQGSQGRSEDKNRIGTGTGPNKPDTEQPPSSSSSPPSSSPSAAQAPRAEAEAEPPHYDLVMAPDQHFKASYAAPEPQPTTKQPEQTIQTPAPSQKASDNKSNPNVDSKPSDTIGGATVLVTTKQTVTTSSAIQTPVPAPAQAQAPASAVSNLASANNSDPSPSRNNKPQAQTEQAPRIQAASNLVPTNAPSPSPSNRPQAQAPPNIAPRPPPSSDWPQVQAPASVVLRPPTGSVVANNPIVEYAEETHEQVFVAPSVLSGATGVVFTDTTLGGGALAAVGGDQTFGSKAQNDSEVRRSNTRGAVVRDVQPRVLEDARDVKFIRGTFSGGALAAVGGDQTFSSASTTTGSGTRKQRRERQATRRGTGFQSQSQPQSGAGGSPATRK